MFGDAGQQRGNVVGGGADAHLLYDDPLSSRRSSAPASTAIRSTLKRLLALITQGFYVAHLSRQAVKNVPA
ncbi:hypothetical protein VPH35_004295 [Triticum aestivum]